MRKYIKVFFTSPAIYFSIVLIISSGVLTYAWNARIYGLYAFSDPIDASSRFILSNVVGNGVMLFLAPLIASIPAYAFCLQMPFSKVNALLSTFGGGVLFAIAYFFSYVLCVLLRSTSALEIGYLLTVGLFPNIYTISSSLYCLCFIAHSVLFGCIYGFFGYSLIFFLKNKSLALSLTMVIYYLPVCIAAFLNKVPILASITPFFVFEVVSFSINPVEHYLQLVFVLFAGCVLLFCEKKQRALTNNPYQDEYEHF